MSVGGVNGNTPVFAPKSVSGVGGSTSVGSSSSVGQAGDISFNFQNSVQVDSTVTIDPDAQKMSISDMASELMIMMLKNANETKATEREMSAEMSAIQFQNGMEIAKFIQENGDTAFKQAIAGAVIQLTTAVANGATTTVVQLKINRQKNTLVDNQEKDGGGSSTIEKGDYYTEAQKQNIQNIGNSVNQISNSIFNTAKSFTDAYMNKSISENQAKQKILETGSNLAESIKKSADSSVNTQNSAIQFCLNMIQQINSLAHDSTSRITGNMR